MRDLKAWCHLIDRHDHWQGIPEEIAGIKWMAVSSLTADVMALTTAHKSKGLEFGSDLKTWEYSPEQAPVLG